MLVHRKVIQSTNSVTHVVIKKNASNNNDDVYSCWQCGGQGEGGTHRVALPMCSSPVVPHRRTGNAQFPVCATTFSHC